VSTFISWPLYSFHLQRIETVTRISSSTNASASKSSLNLEHSLQLMLSLSPCNRYALCIISVGLSSCILTCQEETEYRSDGTNRIIRPARLSLARVSVLRGDGPKEGVPFIDDHIHTSEVIVDYLTEFSGIKCKCSPLSLFPG
jgi:hypothetical protein